MENPNIFFTIFLALRILLVQLPLGTTELLIEKITAESKWNATWTEINPLIPVTLADFTLYLGIYNISVISILLVFLILSLRKESWICGVSSVILFILIILQDIIIVAMSGCMLWASHTPSPPTNYLDDKVSLILMIDFVFRSFIITGIVLVFFCAVTEGCTNGPDCSGCCEGGGNTIHVAEERRPILHQVSEQKEIPAQRVFPKGTLFVISTISIQK